MVKGRFLVQKIEKKSVLLFEKDPVLVRSLRRSLPRCGFKVKPAENLQGAQESFKKNQFAAVILDIDSAGKESFSWIEELQGAKGCPVLLFAKSGQTNLVMEALKKGALDFLVKPFAFAELRDVLNQISKKGGRKKIQFDPSQDPFRDVRDLVIGTSRSMRQIMREIGQAADQTKTLLITGEESTGKETVARMTHKFSSQTHSGFISFHLDRMEPSQLEKDLSLLFSNGNISGKPFKGTVFLDDINLLPMDLQGKMLETLNHKSKSFRLIVSSTRNLKDEAKAGRLLPELSEALLFNHVEVPPLRRRKEDIPHLVNLFLGQLKKNAPILTKGAVDKISDYHWPGNAIELRSFLYSLAVTYPKQKVTKTHIIKQLRLDQEAQVYFV